MNSDSDVMSFSSDTAAVEAQTLLLNASSVSGLRLTLDSIVAGVVTSVISWVTLYYLFCVFSPRHTSEWHCRSVTVLHAIIVVILSGWSAFVEGPWPFTDPGLIMYFLT